MNILTFPKDAKALRTVAEPVTSEMIASEDFKAKLAEMKEIAKKDGIGLAATQVGWNVQLFILMVNRFLQRLDEPFVVINPRIIVESGDVSVREGCLSFPGLELKVSRPAKIVWTAENLLGERIESEEVYVPNSEAGYFIRVIQHETDHLNGRLMIDRASSVQLLKFDRWMKTQ